MSLNTTQDKAPVYNVDKNYAIRKEKIFFFIRLLIISCHNQSYYNE